jgi:hypothetical protein
MVEFAFAKSCLPGVHSAKFAKEQRKAWLLLEPE